MLGHVHPRTDVILLMDSCFSGTVADLQYTYVSKDKFVNENPSNKLAARVICISGCKDDQTSSDAYNLHDNLKFSGACTSSFLASMNDADYDITCFKLLKAMHSYLDRHNFTQRPQLTCSRVLSSTCAMITCPTNRPFMQNINDATSESVET
jgi:hypothetical protein